MVGPIASTSLCDCGWWVAKDLAPSAASVVAIRRFRRACTWAPYKICGKTRRVAAIGASGHELTPGDDQLRHGQSPGAWGVDPPETLVRCGLVARIDARSHAAGGSVLACASSPLTGHAEWRMFNGRINMRSMAWSSAKCCSEKRNEVTDECMRDRRLCVGRQQTIMWRYARRASAARRRALDNLTVRRRGRPPSNLRRSGYFQ
jgi:hypothetical protein